MLRCFYSRGWRRFDWPNHRYVNKADTDITAIAFVLDPELGKINTPHGEVSFLQMVGITTNEYEQLKQNPKTTETKKLVEQLQQTNELFITDLKRK